MPNSKKPSDRVEEVFASFNKAIEATKFEYEFENIEKEHLFEVVKKLVVILDEHATELTTLRKNMKKLKKPKNLPGINPGKYYPPLMPTHKRFVEESD